MNERIKKIASKIEDTIPKSNTVQEIYYDIIPLLESQKVYFSLLGAENIVKLVFYIYSLKTQNDFILADKLLNQISFANLFTRNEDFYTTECQRCDGQGSHDCSHCGRSGTNDCEYCHGNGVVECEYCGGDGTDPHDDDEKCNNCRGTGEETCPRCGGEGEYDCTNKKCDEGWVECERCEGTGEIETNEHEYTSYFIATWNTNLKNKCELEEDTLNPVMSFQRFESMSSQYIILKSFEDHHIFIPEVKSGEMYCNFFDDEPTLEFDKSMRITGNFNSINIEEYIE